VHGVLELDLLAVASGDAAVEVQVAGENSRVEKNAHGDDGDSTREGLLLGGRAPPLLGHAVEGKGAAEGHGGEPVGVVPDPHHRGGGEGHSQRPPDGAFLSAHVAHGPDSYLIKKVFISDMYFIYKL